MPDDSFVFQVEEGRLDAPLPRFVRVRQRFEAPEEPDVAAAVIREVRRLEGVVHPGMTVAVGVGSRGIADLPLIVSTAVAELTRLGARPFIVPAMGSHGGATPEGQREVLAGYGITPDAVGAEIHAGMDTRIIWRTAGGIAVHFSREALAADAVLPLNRVKVHTSFHGPVESGLSKMLTVGFGKHKGAAALHHVGADAFEWLIPEAATLVLEQVPVVGGLAVVENAYERVAHLEMVMPGAIPQREPELLDLSRKLMPGIPFKDLDLLVVDYIGKDISGDGMDPNLTGRHPNPRMAQPERSPRKIVVLRLTERTHGNVNGLGLADLTTRAVVESIDYQQTWTNAVTSLELEYGKTPMWVADDRTAIALALSTCTGVVVEAARAVRIRSTLDLEHLWVSEALWQSEGGVRSDLEALGEPGEIAFNEAGNLVDLPLA